MCIIKYNIRENLEEKRYNIPHNKGTTIKLQLLSITKIIRKFS